MNHLDALEYVSELEPIWTERYWRLFRIYRDKRKGRGTKYRHTAEEALVLAYTDLKRWKETGEL